MAIQTKIQIVGDASSFDLAARNVKRQMVQLTDSTKKMGDTLKGALRKDGIADFGSMFTQLTKDADTATGKFQVMSSLAASFGGPWGIAIASVTAAVVALADKFDWFGEKAVEANRKAQEEIEKTREAASKSFGEDLAKTGSIEAVLKSEEIKDFEERIKEAGKEYRDLLRLTVKYEGTSKGEDYGRQLQYKKEYLDSQIAALKKAREEYKKLTTEEAKDEKLRTPSNSRENKLTGSQWNKVGLGSMKPVLTGANNGATLGELLGINPQDLNTLGQLNAYISQMNAELQNAQIGSEAYNQIAEGIKEATDRQKELNGELKEGVDRAQETQKAMMATSSIFSSASDALGNFSENSKEAAAAQKALAVAEQVAAMAAAIHSAANGGDPYTVAARIAAAAAAVVASIAQMSKFSNGGIVEGNHSGDGVVARLNGGEMVLNKHQQSNLFRQLNSGGGSGGSTTIYMRTRGKELVAATDNYNTSVRRLR